MSVDREIQNLQKLIDTSSRERRNLDAYVRASRLMREAGEALLSAEQTPAVEATRTHLANACASLVTAGAEGDEDA